MAETYEEPEAELPSGIEGLWKEVFQRVSRNLASVRTYWELLKPIEEDEVTMVIGKMSRWSPDRDGFTWKDVKTAEMKVLLS